MRDQAWKLREMAGSGAFGAAVLREARSVVRSIAVTSGKGGVGKSNISLFLAVSLTRMKKKVLIVDADLGLANVHILLGAAPRFNLGHAIRGECSIEQTVWNGPGGIHLLPGASGIEAMANLDHGELERIASMLTALESGYDYLIIDTAAGIGSSVTGLASRADLPLVVMTPEPTSLADAYAMTKVLFERGVDQIAVVVNMAASEREGMETFDRLSTLVVKFLQKRVSLYGILPFDREVSRYVKKQQLLVLQDPGGAVSEKISLTARKIMGLPAAEKPGFFKRLLRAA